MARLLLISNSTLHGSGYLDHAETEIRDFLDLAAQFQNFTDESTSSFPNPTSQDR
jgi:hypothetical protein